MDPNQRMRLAKQLMAEQFDRPTPQDYPVSERSSLLPLATYENGQTGLAWPGFIADDIPNALTAPARALRGELPNYLDDRDAYIGEGLNFAGTAAVGGSAVPRPGGALASNGARVQNPIRAYHGSPHDFDKFDLSKIGTGEGAQAFGHGLYFAENEGVARSYRNGLSDASGVTFGGVKPSENATASLLRNNYDVTATLADLNNAASVAKGWGDNALLAKIKDDIAEIEGFAGKPMQSPGRMYEVNIHASPDDFLDWDKPLSQQSEKVRSLADKDLAGFGEPGRDPLGMSGAEFYRGLDDPMGAMKNHGIAGTRYLDQGSRAARDGSYNYSVNNDALIEILRKYGLLGMMGGGAAALAGGQPAEAADRQSIARALQQ